MSDDDRKAKAVDKPITRRDFFALIGTGAVSITMVGGTIVSWKFLSPNVLLEPSTSFKVGNPSDFPPDSVTLDTRQKVFIVREREGYFYALSAVCTHLGCIANWRPEEGLIACPCHGSKFDKRGRVLTGPAPKALPRFQITLDDKGTLTVDKGVTVGEDYILKV